MSLGRAVVVVGGVPHRALRDHGRRGRDLAAAVDGPRAAAYPVAQVGAAMVQGEGRGLVNRFFKSRAMWYGCAIPVLWGSLEALHQYEPSMPNVSLQWSMPYFGQHLQLRIIFALVGFSYLINTSISAGLWIFQLLVRAESRSCC